MTQGQATADHGGSCLPPLLRRLSALTPLSREDENLVLGLCASPRAQPARSEICAEGAAFPPRVLLSGWACQQRLLSDGRRQIVSFLVPGDVLGSLVTPRLPEPGATIALTSVVTADAGPLGDLVNGTGAAHPGLVRAMRIMMAQTDLILRQHIVRLGRQTAYERLTHLLLEFSERLELAGLVEHERYALPLTQEMLADALGLSIVHLNRTLQQIRRDGLVETKDGDMTLLRARLMRAVCDWAPLPRPES